MEIKYFRRAEKMSKKSVHRHQLGAVIIMKNKILGEGFNKIKTHPKANSYSNCIHAEFDAIINCRGKNLKNATLYIYRSNKSGMPAPSYPCIYCWQLIESSGISRVCYTDVNTYKEVVV